MSYIPMTFGMILSRFFELARAKWRLLWSVSAIYLSVIIVLAAAIIGPLYWQVLQSVLSHPEHPEFPAFGWNLLAFYLIYPLYLVLYALYLPAAALASMRANRNEAVTLGEAWQFGFASFWRFLWLCIRMFLIIVVPILAGAAILLGGAAGAIALATHGSGDQSAFFVLIPLLVLYYLAAACFGIWLGIRFSVSSFAAVNENLSAAQAMKRSWELTRNNFWRVFGTLLVVGLIIYAVQMVLTFVIYFLIAIGAFIGIAGHAEQNHLLLGILVGIGATIFVGFIIAISAAQHAAFQAVLAINYDDLCKRQEVRTEPQPPAFPGALPAA